MVAKATQYGGGDVQWKPKTSLACA